MKSLGASGYQQDSCEVSKKNVGTSRVGVKPLGRYLEPAGYL